MDDLALAALLGEAPRTPDPGFRLDVFARMTARAHKRAAVERALLQVAAFTALGLVVGLVQFASMEAHALLPVLGVAGALALACAFALAVIAGPKAALARVSAVLRIG